MATIIMFGRIKLFRCVRRLFRSIGIVPTKHSEHFAFNWRNLLISPSILIMLVLQVAFFFFKAKSIQEYGLSFYGCVSLILIVFYAAIIVWQMPNILKLMKNLEKFIELSKSGKQQSCHDLTLSILKRTKNNSCDQMFRLKMSVNRSSKKYTVKGHVHKVD